MHGGSNRIYGLHVIIAYITDCFQNAKSLTIFEDFVVQGQGLVNWFSRILEDKNTGILQDYVQMNQIR